MPAQRVILCPVDFSAASMEAFQVGVAIARDRGIGLLVLHVSPRPLTTLGGAEAVPPSPAEFDLTEARKQLAGIQAPARVAMETRLEVGEPADVIIESARKSGCELIVMGTQGRTGLGRLLLGSVAEKVMRDGPCPVLMLKSR